MLLKNANIPGRVVWTGSSTCSKEAFDWDDPQHIKGHLSFYSHKYLTHLLQPALNEHLKSTGIQSFEGCPGLILTGASPKFLRNMSLLMYILRWVLFIRLFIPLFIPLFIHSIIHSFDHSFIHSFDYSFDYSFIRSFIHSIIHSLTPYNS